MDKVPKLGALIDTNEKCDAVHIAVAPVIATEKMYPGNGLEFCVKGNTEKVVACNMTRAIGIVDPFLTQPVLPGQQFWMFLKPGTITGLRHEWTHPAFDDATGLAEFWMREFADKHNMDAEYLLSMVRDGTTEFAFGDDINYPSDEDEELFKKYASMITGREFIGTPSFRCAC